MILTSNDVPALGLEIHGQVMKVLDDTSVYAIYDCEHVSVGVVYETEARVPYFLFSPAVQVPEFARAGFMEFAFKQDDVRWVKLRFDEDDGEIKFRHEVEGFDPFRLEAVVEEYLEFIDTTVYPATLSYIAGELAKQRD